MTQIVQLVHPLENIQKSLDFVISSLKNNAEMFESVSEETSRLITTQDSYDLEANVNTSPSVASDTLKSLTKSIDAFRFALYQTKTSYRYISMLVADNQRKSIVKRRTMSPPDLYVMN